MTKMESKTTYLVAEKDLLDVKIVTQMLHTDNHGDVRVEHVSNFGEVIDQLGRKTYDALILGLDLESHEELAQLHDLTLRFPTLPIVILTDKEDQDIAFKCLHIGVQDYVSKNQMNSELITRIMRYAIERKQIDLQLKNALEEADKKNKQLTLLARTDTLTKLPNRAYFFEVTQHAIASAKRLKKSVGILYFDLNGFKFINDNFGHSVGDQVLVELSRRLKEHLRTGDTVARVGGDEFVVLTTMLEEPVQAYSVAKKVNQILCEPLLIDDNEFSMSASIGIATYPEVGSVDKLVQCADMAMYEAKASKQHFACFYTKQLEEKYNTQRQMESALESAIQAGELHATYQPIITAADDTFHVEALCRWSSGNLGLIAPNKFIPIAEASKLGDHLGSFMLREGAKFKARCEARGMTLDKLALNIFGRQFTDKRFAQRLLTELEELELPAEFLCVEITERQMIENLTACQTQLKLLKNHGVTVALDDFGTGFSSVTHLKSLPIDFLKLDRSLTAFIDTTEDNHALCDGIIHMAHRLKMEVVGEGIERQEEFDTLLSMGCDKFQGHLFGFPMSETDLLDHWQSPHIDQIKQLTPSPQTNLRSV